MKNKVAYFQKKFQNLHFIRNLQRDIILRKNVLALKIIDSLELNLLIWPSHLLSLQALIDIAKGAASVVAGWPNTKGTKKQSEQHVLTQIPGDALSAAAAMPLLLVYC